MADLINDSFRNKNTDYSGIRNMERFDGYFDHRYKNVMMTGQGFVFFTRPSLYITSKKPNPATPEKDVIAYQNTYKDPFFSLFLNDEAMNDQDSKIIDILSYKDDIKTNWIKIFTNECKNFDPGDITLDTLDVFETKQGYRMPLPTHSVASTAAGQLTFNMVETANLDLTKIISLWTKYIEHVSDATFRANPEMIQNGVLDYMCSIYYFLLGPDGRTIKYWEKYTGCWPANIPNSPFRFTKGERELVEISVNFNYLTKETMNPRIFEDFNRTSLRALTYSVEEDEPDSKRDYLSFKDSPLLNYNKLKSNRFASTVNSEDRDPLVFFNEASLDQHRSTPDPMKDRYELSFGVEDMKDIFSLERFSEYDKDTYKGKL